MVVLAKLVRVVWDALRVVFAPLNGQDMDHARVVAALHCNHASDSLFAVIKGVIINYD